MKPNNYSKLLQFSLFFIFLICPIILFGQDPFITIWKTNNPGSSNSNQIKIPANGMIGIYWEEVGDSSNNGTQVANPNNTSQYTISFPSSGKYRVEITPLHITGRPLFTRINFNNEGDKDKLIKIEQWGDVEWSSFKTAFFGCENLAITATDIPDLSNVSDMSSAFRGATISNIPNINSWDMSNVTDMDWLFFGVTQFNNNIENWNVSNVEIFSHMFGNTTFNQDISNWDVSSATDMREMFINNSDFNQNIGGWDISNVSDMVRMFKYSGMTCENYSTTLYGWAENLNTPENINLGAKGLEYSPDIEDQRNHLINDLGWTINGDSQGNCELSNNSYTLTNIALYPNPTTNQANLDGLQGDEHIQIFDLQGKLVKQVDAGQTNQISLDIQNLDTGIYFIKISNTDGASVTKKLIKK